MDDDPLLTQFSAEFAELRERVAILWTLRPEDAWILLSQLQLAFRHPQNIGESRRIAERIARQLEAAVATTPALAEMSRRGWHAEYDEVSTVLKDRAERAEAELAALKARLPALEAAAGATTTPPVVLRQCGACGRPSAVLFNGDCLLCIEARWREGSHD